MKIGVIDVGGGFRGIYACGVLDYCLDQNIRFNLGIGISAGSANLASFVAGQRGRHFIFYTVYGLRKEHSAITMVKILLITPLCVIIRWNLSWWRQMPKPARQSILISGIFGRMITAYLRHLRRSPLSAGPISFRGYPIMTGRLAILFQWKRRLLPGATVLSYCLPSRKVSSEPRKRTRSWRPASAKSIPMRRRSCGRGRADTTRASHWRRNTQGKGKF